MMLALYAAVIAMVLATAGQASEAGVNFTGYLADASGARFKLTSVRTGESSWVTVGQTFDGYVVKTYDRGAEVLVVAKSGIETRLPLARSRVQRFVRPRGPLR